MTPTLNKQLGPAEPTFDIAFQQWLNANHIQSDWEEFKKQYGDDKWSYLREWDDAEKFAQYCDHDYEPTESDVGEDGVNQIISTCKNCGSTRTTLGPKRKNYYRQR